MSIVTKITQPGNDSSGTLDGRVRLDDTKGLILNDGSNNLGIFGYDDSGDMVVKVAKAGYDANSATDDQLIFNSNQNVLKIVDKIVTEMPSFTTNSFGANVGGRLLTVQHGMTFIPLVQAFVQAEMLEFGTFSTITSSFIPLPVYSPGNAVNGANIYWFPSTTSGTSYPLSIIFGVDVTNIYVQAQYYTGSPVTDTIAPIPLTLLLLQETAA